MALKKIFISFFAVLIFSSTFIMFASASDVNFTTSVNDYPDLPAVLNTTYKDFHYIMAKIPGSYFKVIVCKNQYDYLTLVQDPANVNNSYITLNGLRRGQAGWNNYYTYCPSTAYGSVGGWKVDTSGYESINSLVFPESSIIDFQILFNIYITNRMIFLYDDVGAQIIGKWLLANKYSNYNIKHPEYKVSCISPADGYKQSQINMVVCTWHIIVPYDNISGLSGTKINVLGYLLTPAAPMTAPTYSGLEWTTYPGYLDGVFKTEGYVSFDVDRQIILSVTDTYGKLWTANITVHCYSDFADINGDGKDDRAQDTFFDRESGVIDTGKSTIDLISNVKGAINMISVALPSLSSWLPASLIAIIVFGFSLVIILRILGR